VTDPAVAAALLLPPVPVPDADSAGWWEALAGGTLAICRCRGCRRWLHPPLEACRHCGAPTALEPVSGRGTIFSFIVVRHQAVPGHTPPYVVAIVDLDEQRGLRLTGRVDADPARVTIGAAVRAEIRAIGDSGFSGPTFVLD
jgi:uncharacterized OB-fold protein